MAVDAHGDSVTKRPLVALLLTAAVVLILSLAWALWNGARGQHPGKEYQRLDQKVAAAEKAAEPRLREVGRELNKGIALRLKALDGLFQAAYRRIAALIRRIETSGVSHQSRPALRDNGAVER